MLPPTTVLDPVLLLPRGDVACSCSSSFPWLRWLAPTVVPPPPPPSPIPMLSCYRVVAIASSPAHLGAPASSSMRLGDALKHTPHVGPPPTCNWLCDTCRGLTTSIRNGRSLRQGVGKIIEIGDGDRDGVSPLEMSLLPSLVLTIRNMIRATCSGNIVSMAKNGLTRNNLF